MELTRSLVETSAAEYRRTQPLAAVEAEHVEVLPGMFAEGEFGWRDAEWVVQWYFRRHLGAYPDDHRRATEEAFGDNSYEAVRDLLVDVAETDNVAETLRRLQTLEGVDVPVGSAFLFFSDPENRFVVGERVWGTLFAAGELSGQYPAPPSIEEYLTFHDVCRELTAELEVYPYTLYRALWQLGSDESPSIE